MQNDDDLPPGIPRELIEDLEKAALSFGKKMEEMLIARREREAAWEAENGPINASLRAQAEEIFTMDGLECWIIKSPLWREMEEKGQAVQSLVRSSTYKHLIGLSGYCGYVVFPKKPTVEPDYHGIITYIPVHGGVTYTHHDAFGSVYGFDTAHAGSEKLPTRDKEWIRGQIDILARGLLIAASIEEEYLKADGDNKRRAELVQPILDLQPGPLNFNVLLNLLGGEL